MPKKRTHNPSQQQLDFALEPSDLTRRQRFRARCQMIETASLVGLTAGQANAVRRLLKHLLRKGGIVTLRYQWLATDLAVSLSTAKRHVDWARGGGVIETAVSCDQYGRRRTTVEIIWSALQPGKLNPNMTQEQPSVRTPNIQRMQPELSITTKIAQQPKSSPTTRVPAQPTCTTTTSGTEQPMSLITTTSEEPTTDNAHRQPQGGTTTSASEQPSALITTKNQEQPRKAIPNNSIERQQSAPKSHGDTLQSVTVNDQSLTVDRPKCHGDTFKIPEDPNITRSLPRSENVGNQIRITFDQLAHLVTELRAAMRYREDNGHNVARIAAAAILGLLPENDVRDAARGVGVLRPRNPPAYFFSSVANACVDGDTAALRRLLGRIHIDGLIGGPPPTRSRRDEQRALYDALYRGEVNS